MKGSIREGNILGNSFQFQSDICHQKVKDVFCVTLGLLSHIILSNPHKKINPVSSRKNIYLSHFFNGDELEAPKCEMLGLNVATNSTKRQVFFH